MLSNRIIKPTTDPFLGTVTLGALSSHPQVLVATCDYRATHYRDDLFSRHRIAFPDTLQRAVVKRKSEFLAGRYLCQQVLEKLGVPHGQIGIGNNRQPLWPQGIIGTISHTKDKAMCALARDADIEAIGMDVENMVSSHLAKNIQEMIISIAETEYLAKLSLPFEQAFTLAFSGKESLFKALYARVGRYFDFSAAVIDKVELGAAHTMNDEEGGQGTFRLTLTQELDPSLTKGQGFQGYFQYESSQLISWIVVR